MALAIVIGAVITTGVFQQIGKRPSQCQGLKRGQRQFRQLQLHTQDIALAGGDSADEFVQIAGLARFGLFGRASAVN